MNPPMVRPSPAGGSKLQNVVEQFMRSPQFPAHVNPAFDAIAAGKRDAANSQLQLAPTTSNNTAISVQQPTNYNTNGNVSLPLLVDEVDIPL